MPDHSRFPIFIIGAPRSGTSILYRILQQHRSLKPKQFDLTESGVFDYVFKIHRINAEGYLKEAYSGYMLNNEAVFRSFLKTTIPHRTLSRFLYGYVKPRIENRWKVDLDPWLFHLVFTRHFYRTYFRHAKRAREVSRIIEKTPRNLKNIQYILNCFPSARLLYSIRHPVTTYSSYLRRNQISPSPWLDLSSDDFIGMYNNDYRVLKENIEVHPNSILLITYEKLIAKDTGQLSAISKFLDLELTYEMLQSEEVELQNWNVDPLLSGGLVDRPEYWNKYVTESEASRIMENCSQAMAYYGYRDSRL